jgi:hypothetical protein
MKAWLHKYQTFLAAGLGTLMYAGKEQVPYINSVV